MGNLQHNTNIANSTESTIKAVLTSGGKSRLNTSQIVEPGEYVCIPTPYGRGTLSVFRKMKDGTFSNGVEAQYTDRSFLIQEEAGSLTIVRTKYGTIWQEEYGLRS